MSRDQGVLWTESLKGVISKAVFNIEYPVNREELYQDKTTNLDIPRKTLVPSSRQYTQQTQPRQNSQQ